MRKLAKLNPQGVPQNPFQYSYLVTRASNNGWEDSTGSVITGKPSLDQARAVVAHQGGGLVVVTHLWSFLGWPSVRDRGWKHRQNIS